MSHYPSAQNAFLGQSLCTVAEAAKFVRVSKQTIYNAIESGELPARKFTPKLFRLRTADVVRWAGIDLEADETQSELRNYRKEADL